MAQIKVMISGFYKGGAWTDKDTRNVFDPRKDEGKVFTFSGVEKFESIMESIAKNHLVAFDTATAIQFEKIARDLPVVAPQIVSVRGKLMQLEITFDRPVYPIPGKQVHVPTKEGNVSVDVKDAYMEGHATAVFAVNATGPIKLDAGSFIDDEQRLSEKYPVTAASSKKEDVKETKEAKETKEDAPEVKEDKEVVAPKKAPAKRSRKKTEDAE